MKVILFHTVDGFINCFINIVKLLLLEQLNCLFIFQAQYFKFPK
jgi:hypothetical protein